MKSNIVKTVRSQSMAEELANVITHFAGGMAAIVGFAVLMYLALNPEEPLRYISLFIYGTSLVLVYLASTLYHGVAAGPVKQFFRAIDQSAVFLLIAGTYTPIVANFFNTKTTIYLMTYIWGLSFVGILLRFFRPRIFSRLAVPMYLLLGWSFLGAYKQAKSNFPDGLFFWIALGGLLYTLGLIFYKWKALPFHHTWWHLFVIAGSASHYTGIFMSLAC